MVFISPIVYFVFNCLFRMWGFLYLIGAVASVVHRTICDDVTNLSGNTAIEPT
jgi:hypothetical protein